MMCQPYDCPHCPGPTGGGGGGRRGNGDAECGGLWRRMDQGGGHRGLITLWSATLTGDGLGWGVLCSE